MRVSLDSGVLINAVRGKPEMREMALIVLSEPGYEIGAPDAKKHGISVMDALHIAAANLSNCPYFIRTENATKPMFRTKLVTVVGLSPTSTRVFHSKKLSASSPSQD